MKNSFLLGLFILVSSIVNGANAQAIEKCSGLPNGEEIWDGTLRTNSYNPNDDGVRVRTEKEFVIERRTEIDLSGVTRARTPGSSNVIYPIPFLLPEEYRKRYFLDSQYIIKTGAIYPFENAQSIAKDVCVESLNSPSEGGKGCAKFVKLIADIDVHLANEPVITYVNSLTDIQSNTPIATRTVRFRNREIVLNQYRTEKSEDSHYFDLHDERNAIYFINEFKAAARPEVSESEPAISVGDLTILHPGFLDALHVLTNPSISKSRISTGLSFKRFVILAAETLLDFQTGLRGHSSETANLLSSPCQADKMNLVTDMINPGKSSAVPRLVRLT